MLAAAPVAAATGGFHERKEDICGFKINTWRIMNGAFREEGWKENVKQIQGIWCSAIWIKNTEMPLSEHHLECPSLTVLKPAHSVPCLFIPQQSPM